MSHLLVRINYVKLAQWIKIIKFQLTKTGSKEDILRYISKIEQELDDAVRQKRKRGERVKKIIVLLALTSVLSAALMSCTSTKYVEDGDKCRDKETGRYAKAENCQ